MITSNFKTYVVQDAENIPFTPTGNISASNVQDAIVELDTEKAVYGS